MPAASKCGIFPIFRPKIRISPKNHPTPLGRSPPIAPLMFILNLLCVVISAKTRINIF